MNKTIRILSVGTLFLVVGLIWCFTPSASSTSKQKESARTKQERPDGPYRSPGANHKLSVSDEKAAESLRAQGARLIADYGSYKLFDVKADVAAKVDGHAGIQVVDENNLVLLNSGTMDTTTAESQDLRSTKQSLSGKQMHLIQFAGPIKPEWYQELLATGARVVTYIPNNAYLVYGSSKSLTAVRTLATRQYVQWDNPYTSSHRIAPTINAQSNSKNLKQQPISTLSAKGNRLFAIQLVNDRDENAKTLALIDQLKLEPIVRQANVLDYVNVVVALRAEEAMSQLAERGDVVSIAPWERPHKMDERQDLIIANGTAPAPQDYLAYLVSHGYSTATTSFGVNVTDSGLDNGTTTPNHFGLYALGNPTSPANSRVVYARLVGTPTGPGSTLQACDGHGISTHT